MSTATYEKLKVIQWLSETFPIAHFLVILRGIIVKGVDITYLWTSTIVMILITVTAIKFTEKLD